MLHHVDGHWQCLYAGACVPGPLIDVTCQAASPSSNPNAHPSIHQHSFRASCNPSVSLPPPPIWEQ